MPKPEKSKLEKIPSPCISVCKFRREGHCIGCSMTKGQKKLFKKLKKADQQDAFLTFLLHQQSSLGKYTHWTRSYQRKLTKKGLKRDLSL